MSRTTSLAVIVLVTALTAGCAGTGDGSDGPSGTSSTNPSAGAVSPSPGGADNRAESPGLSSTEPPTLRPPSGPPKTPSDLLSGGPLVGTVTRGGSGPCYGLVTDDGEEYALYSDAGITLRQHTRVRVRTAPLKLKIDCGTGRPMSMLTAEPIR